MPAQQIATNTAAIARSASFISELRGWIELMVPIVGGILAVFAWAWKRMQRSIDNIEIALTLHATKNEESFDELWTDHRKVSNDFYKLQGKCETFIHTGVDNGK